MRRRRKAIDLALQRVRASVRGEERLRAAEDLVSLATQPTLRRAAPRRQRDWLFAELAGLVRRDPDSTVRLLVAHALGRWYEGRSAHVLLRVLAEPGEAARVRGQAAESIGNVLAGAPGVVTRPGTLRARAIDVLRAQLASTDAEVRFWSTRALGLMFATEARAELEALARTDEALCPYLWSVRWEAEDALLFWQKGRWPERPFTADGDGRPLGQGARAGSLCLAWR